MRLSPPYVSTHRPPRARPSAQFVPAPNAHRLPRATARTSQFYAYEIARNRLGLNDRAHEIAKEEAAKEKEKAEKEKARAAREKAKKKKN